MKLTIEIATRGRPEILKETVDTFLTNMACGDTTLMLCVDEDDEATRSAIPGWNIKDTRLLVSVKPREITRGLKYDRALKAAPADVYLIGVDHTPVHTPAFDQIICDAAARFPDGIGVVCAPPANASFPYLQAPTAKFCELMGYIQPPHFPYWFIDHWLDDVARMTGRYAMVDIEVESNRRPGGTIGLRHVVFWATYFDALAGERREQANRIIDAMDEPEWRKSMLRDNFPMIEFRSRWINDICRNTASDIEASRGGEPPDELYLTALRKATGHLLELYGEPQKAAA